MHGRFVYMDKTLTDLQILGCELYQNTFGGRTPPGPAGRAISLPTPVCFSRPIPTPNRAWLLGNHSLTLVASGRPLVYQVT